jgi:hydrogenase expression/formation protein HypE
LQVAQMPDSLPVGKLPPELLSGLLHALPSDPSVLIGPGIGCDVAVIDTGGPFLLLAKSAPIPFATDEIGFYAVVVNSNDIATAGGTPRYFLATILLPESDADRALISSILTQLTGACEKIGISLIGGHTEVTGGLNRPIIAGTMLGEVARDGLVTNAGTQVGDVLLLTKAIAIEGTSVIARERRSALLAGGFPPEWLDGCARMLHNPGISVLPDARAIIAAVRPHAMHDPTEGGLATAVWEVAAAAGVGVEVNCDAVPVLPQTASLCTHFGLDPLGLLASGSLLVAVAACDASAAIQACRERGIPCAPIARVVPPDQGVTALSAGLQAPLPRFDQDELTRVL